MIEYFDELPDFIDVADKTFTAYKSPDDEYIGYFYKAPEDWKPVAPVEVTHEEFEEELFYCVKEDHLPNVIKYVGDTFGDKYGADVILPNQLYFSKERLERYLILALENDKDKCSLWYQYEDFENMEEILRSWEFFTPEYDPFEMFKELTGCGWSEALDLGVDEFFKKYKINF